MYPTGILAAKTVQPAPVGQKSQKPLFQGIYQVASVKTGDTVVDTLTLPGKADVEDSYTESPKLVQLADLFRKLMQVGQWGSNAQAFKWVDEPTSRVYSPEDVSGPYLYSTRQYLLTDDAAGNHLTAWADEVTTPSENAAAREMQSGRLSKAPPGYSARLRATEAFFEAYRPEATPVQVTLPTGDGFGEARALRVTPLDTRQSPFQLSW